MAQYRIESDVRPFIESLARWQETALSFNEAVFGGVAHAALLGHGDDLIAQLAEEFEVARITVVRWANGVARPHPRLQRLIVASVAARLKTIKAGPPRPKRPALRPLETDPEDTPGNHTPDR